MKNKWAAILFFILTLVLPVLAFFLVYFYTGKLFQKQKFPYPFELFGIAAGFGTACWVYAIIRVVVKMTSDFIKGGKNEKMVY